MHFHHPARQGDKMSTGNKIIGGECVLIQEFVLQPKNYLIKAVKDEKLINRMKMTTNVVVAVATTV